jgi:hypothetical protein
MTLRIAQPFHSVNVENVSRSRPVWLKPTRCSIALRRQRDGDVREGSSHASARHAGCYSWPVPCATHSPAVGDRVYGFEVGGGAADLALVEHYAPVQGFPSGSVHSGSQGSAPLSTPAAAAFWRTS